MLSRGDGADRGAKAPVTFAKCVCRGGKRLAESEIQWQTVGRQLADSWQTQIWGEKRIGSGSTGVSNVGVARDWGGERLSSAALRLSGCFRIISGAFDDVAPCHVIKCSPHGVTNRDKRLANVANTWQT